MKKFINVICTFAITFFSYNTYSQGTHIVLTSRSFHPSNSSDTLSTLKVIDQLKPSRLDWIYTESANTLKLFKDRNLPFSLAIHPEVGDSAGYTTKKFRIVDINGRPYEAPWMIGSKVYWGCVNNPGFQDFFLKKTFHYSDLGAYAIFVDDGAFNVQLQNDRPNKYGCFCDYCLQGFVDYLAHSNTPFAGQFDENSLKQKFIKVLNDDKSNRTNQSDKNLLVLYQQYQRASVVKFLQNWKSRLQAYRPGIKTLTNNYNGQWNDVYSVFDGGICELSKNNLNVPYLDSVYKVADRLGKTQVFSLVSDDQKSHDFLMAYCYLRGRDYLIPWDLYVPTKTNPQNRFYTDPNKFNKLSNAIKNKEILVKIKKDGNISNDNPWYNLNSKGGLQYLELNNHPPKN